jgi:hypothetical protein
MYVLAVKMSMKVAKLLLRTSMHSNCEPSLLQNKDVYQRKQERYSQIFLNRKAIEHNVARFQNPELVVLSIINSYDLNPFVPQRYLVTTARLKF